MTPALWIKAVALQSGFAETPEPNQVSFQPETGAPILRRRVSLSQDLVTFTAALSSADFDALLYFYRNTIKDGTQQFTMNHPRTGTSATWAWVPGQPPKVN